MINKIFFSFCLEGEEPSSKYQIVIQKNWITDDSTQHRTPIKLRDNVYIDTDAYDTAFINRINGIDLMSIGEFIDYHRDNYEGDLVDFVKKIRFMSDNTNTRHFSYVHDRRMVLQDWVETQHLQSPLKLKWLGKSAQFGYIFQELAQKGFIEVPQTRGQDSYKKYARICFELFEIDGTIGTLENEMNPRRNSLDPSNRDAFKIPKRTDLS